ncbi:MAG TPA: DmsC/YnfH family molybdoenzyme membrane anchor subunit [Dehalococcoidales bacterium]|nr:DmsC/YnfH family molybdoenzyme membrane anchor subunit [Dehalococcoidales bacterium]
MATTMQAHQWMINYTRQTEWIDHRGILLWIAFYTGGLGGGLYLVSLFFNNLWGMFIGWLIICVIKGTTHLMFLGKPLRAWRIIFRPTSSWISRGILFVLSFGFFAAIQMALTHWAPGSSFEMIFKVLAGAAAFAVSIYTGFVLNSVKAVPFWNSKLLPVMFILCGILGGFGLSVVIALNGGGINLESAETGARWLLVINAALIGIYLWMAAKRESTGKKSVLAQLRGELAPLFWTGIVALGIVVPLAIALVTRLTGEISATLLLAGVACEIIGGLSLRYCVLKAGAYKPLVARPH